MNSTKLFLRRTAGSEVGQQAFVDQNWIDRP